MYKIDLVLNNLQWLMYHNTKAKQTKEISFHLKQRLPSIYLLKNNMFNYITESLRVTGVKFLMSNCIIWNHLTVCKKWTLVSDKLFVYKSYIWYIYV